jgi:hypothetical protein
LVSLLVACGLVLGTGTGAAGAHPPASHLHSGEYCSKRLQSWYHRHGYTCKRASDGTLRLFEW